MDDIKFDYFLWVSLMKEGTMKVDTMKEGTMKKKVKERCYHCKKKLKLINFKCRCNYTFCVKCQNPHTHKCSFKAKEAKTIELQKNNIKIVCAKLEKI